MRFAADEWLWSILFAAVIAGVLILQGFRLMRARKRFGDVTRVTSLLTAKTGTRRAISGVLIVLSIALFGLAAAGPQYGKGTRVLPATNLDVVLVLDYSKSMYARDVSPSRIGRAKIEVRRLVNELAGARFGAVAFAGDTLSFPLTSDGAAIAQFFRGLTPNDMPVGGTAIARAVEAGRQLLARDPLSQRHEQVMVLITDGEDLEGDPVAAAETAAAEGIRLEVVQVGGRSPEPIPKIGEDGQPRGMRRDEQGEILTTSLSPEGEAELRRVAETGGGSVVRAKGGSVGIDTITAKLRRLMTEELSERVETVFADVYHFPLTAGVLLLVIEAFIGTSRRRRWKPDPPKKSGRKRVPRRRHVATAAALFLWLPGCATFDSLFERESPVVAEAIEALENDAPERATEILTEYLETGACSDGEIGAGDRAREKGDASFDLALAFTAQFDAESSSEEGDDATGSAPSTPQGLPPGMAPGSGTPPSGSAGPDGGAPPPAPRIECAQRLLSLVAQNPEHPPALRARAQYLAGNLELRREQFETAVDFYDEALRLTPGLPEGQGDPLGADAAYNRALALRKLQEKREQEQKQKEQNKTNNQEGDQDQEQKDEGEEGDQQKKDQEEKGDEQKQDQRKKGDQQKDQKKGDQQEKGDEQKQDQRKKGDQQEDQSKQQPRDQQARDQAQRGKGQARQAETDPSASQDQRILDLLEQTPTLQQHDAKQRSDKIRFRSTMEDK